MSKQDTAQQLRKVANFFEGLVKAADDLEAIGSMEGATAEATKARDAANAERDQALSDAATAKAQHKVDHAAAKKKAADCIQDAELKANAQAAQIVGAAEGQARGIIETAIATSGGMQQTAEAARDKALTEVADLTSKASALADEVATTTLDVQTLAKENDRLTKAIDKLKAQFKIEA